MTQLEREVIILYSAWSMIDSMANWAIFGNLSPDFCDPTEYKTNLKFEGSAEGKIFLIQLRDFLSEVQHYKNKSPLGLKKAPPKPSPSNKTFLFHLREVCKSPQLGKDAIELSRKVEDFGKWLEGEFCHEGDWLPPEIYVSHYRYITMLGDITKHHLGRDSLQPQTIFMTY